jgi:hypothetical protein
MIPHLLKHLFDVGESQFLGSLRLTVLKDIKLPASDLVALDRVRFGIERAHVLDEETRDRGRQFYRPEGHR